MERSAARSVRVAFGVLLLVFVAQLGVTKVWSEPYPGLFQPAFGGSVDEAGTTSVMEPTVTASYADGTTESFSHRDVMAQSKSLQVAVFTSAFGPDSPRRDDPETVAWLERRLAVLGGGKQPESAVLDWREVTYDLADEQAPRSSTTERTTIDFGSARG